ncbi:MAG: hypothetical protein J6X58_04900 [Bacteroidales bacterium]|nr:hypothetical protein [Bacteroidales bacterium]
MSRLRSVAYRHPLPPCNLFGRIVAVCDCKEDNSVKNQYLKVLKKAVKIRK